MHFNTFFFLLVLFLFFDAMGHIDLFRWFQLNMNEFSCPWCFCILLSAVGFACQLNALH